MPKGKRRSGGPKTTISFVVLVVVIIGMVFTLRAFEKKREPAIAGNESVVPAPGLPLLEPEPTDTVEIGAIDAYRTAEGGQAKLDLVQTGEKRTALVLDQQSYCNLGSGGLPCMAMSIDFSTAFSGKRALVDGNRDGDSIVVRRLRILDEGETARKPEPGSVYIPWVRVMDMIFKCETQGLVQTHVGLVNVTTKGGKKYVTVEPVIDEVFNIANKSTAECGDVRIGTE